MRWWVETQARVPVGAAGTAARRTLSSMQPKAVYMLEEEATLSVPQRGWTHPGAAVGLAGAQCGLLASELGAGPAAG